MEASSAGRVTSSQGLVETGWRGPLGPGGCPPPGDDPTERPDRYDYVRVDYSTDPPTVTVLRSRCYVPQAAPPPLPPPPPPPPTLAEITQLVRSQIPAPAVLVNPDQRGVTGLESWFWYEGPQEVTATVSIRGYAVTATMRPSRFYWDPCADFAPAPGDRDRRPLGCRGALASSSPGSRPDPASSGAAAAVRFMYETNGSYVVRHQVLWEGSWSFAGPRVSASGTLPTIRATGERDYPVIEVRGVLTG